jgi:hypothetical protein
MFMRFLSLPLKMAASGRPRRALYCRPGGWLLARVGTSLVMVALGIPRCINRRYDLHKVDVIMQGIFASPISCFWSFQPVNEALKAKLGVSPSIKA